MTQNDIFIDWVKVRGGHISPSINLFGVFAHGSRGIAATADIQQGDVLVLMPMKACIHAYADDEVHLPPAYHDKDNVESTSFR